MSTTVPPHIVDHVRAAVGMVIAMERDDIDAWVELWRTSPDPRAVVVAMTSLSAWWGREAAEARGQTFAEFLQAALDFWAGQAE
jgi:hypothetical protein